MGLLGRARCSALRHAATRPPVDIITDPNDPRLADMEAAGILRRRVGPKLPRFVAPPVEAEQPPPTPRRDRVAALSLAYQDVTGYRDVDETEIWFRENWDK
jgi:hypothetical protein